MNQPSAAILDGKWLSSLVLADIRDRVLKMTVKGGRPPGLGVMLVGDNPASKVYVSNKEKAAKNAGFQTFNLKLADSASFEDVTAGLNSFNADPNVDGILLQLPLPKHLDPNPLLDLIQPTKDADGLHPLNQGLLMRGEGRVRSCTPLGAMKLLDLALTQGGSESVKQISEIKPADLSGKRAIVIGRSILVGKPMGLMLLERNATVTMAQSKTDDLAGEVSRADIVVAAVGVPELIKGKWIKPGAIVIDVGINRTPSGQLVGDVEFKEAALRAAAVTPVPGGAGPMTIAMLIQNTFNLYLSRVA